MIQHVLRRLRRFIRATKAVSALEYAVLVGVIVVGVGAALLTFSDTIEEAIAAIGTDVKTTADSLDAGDLAPDPAP